ncbi:MAG: sigma 54-interacting transcriptional regulator [Pirellulales bacterium]
MKSPRCLRKPNRFASSFWRPTNYRVGGETRLHSDACIISTTIVPAHGSQSKKKTFREDLYYRLNIISIEVPPLRQRRYSIAPVELFTETAHMRHKRAALNA